MVARVIPAVTVIVILEDVMLDRLCFEQALSTLRDRRHAGKQTGYVEAALLANPGIADPGAILPLGLRVNLPEFVIEGDTPIVRLWD